MGEILALGRSGRHEEGLARAHAAQARFPDEPHYYDAEVEILTRAGRPREALELATRTLARWPEHAQTLNGAGTACYHLGSFEEALVYYERARALSDPKSNLELNRALVLQGLGRYEDSVAGSERAIALNPADAEAHYLHGAVLSQLGRVQEARTSLERSLRLDPRRAKSYYELSSVLDALGEPKAAHTALRYACRLEPGRGTWRAELPRLAAKAVAADPSVDLYTDDARARFMKAEEAYEERRYTAALATFREVAALEPNAMAPQLGAATCLLDMDRPQEALAALEAFEARGFGFGVDGVRLKAMALQSLGRADQAEAVLTAGLARMPDDHRLLVSRAYLLEQQGRLDAALKDLTRALELDPGDTQARELRDRVQRSLARDE